LECNGYTKQEKWGCNNWKYILLIQNYRDTPKGFTPGGGDRSWIGYSCW
jgi:hypothetical protein